MGSQPLAKPADRSASFPPAGGRSPAAAVEAEMERRTDGKAVILVGITLDAASRELLTWALVKVSASGDRVIAVHVAGDPRSESSASAGAGAAAAARLLPVLAVYEGFCNLKQVTLELKICSRVSSVRKTLIHEARSMAATMLVVGTAARHRRPFGSSSATVAKFCAKALPGSCSVVAVSNGKVMFRRDALQNDTREHNVQRRRSYSELVGGKVRNLMYLRNLSLPSRPRPPAWRAAEETEERLALVPNRDSGQMPPPPPPAAAGASIGWPLLLRVNLNFRSVLERLPTPRRHSMVSPVFSDQRSLSLSPLLELAILKKFSGSYSLFSYQQLRHMTGNFSAESMIGKGGSSKVYRGRTSGGRDMAIKVLDPASPEALKDFVSEIEIVGSLHHENVVSLIGFCSDSPVLVYEYLPRGSLEQLLHGNHRSRFGWRERLEVAKGVARALEYLHSGAANGGSRKMIIHRDVKSSNILISQDFTPKLSDFGLAVRASETAKSSGCDDVAGTFGYLAPEYLMLGGRITDDKVDVFAFGVVVLELISGRKAVSSAPDRHQPDGHHASLVMWATSVIHGGGNIVDLVDPTLPPADDDGCIERMALAAALCIRRAPQSRPPISQVSKLLDGNGNGGGDLLWWARTQVGIGEQSTAGTAADNDVRSYYINLALTDMDDMKSTDGNGGSTISNSSSSHSPTLRFD